MYSFKNDYSEGAHPAILESLLATNLIQQAGYSEDRFCQEAIQKIKIAIQHPEAEIHFVSGGTQANLLVISSLLRPYESVIAAHSGHIAVHETGAIEATGHKVNTVHSSSGKLTPELIQPILDEHIDEHMVKPKLVYISNTTEIGSVYTKMELEILSQYCKQHGLLLFMDGARLASALTAKNNDLTLADLSTLVDVYYIGGTKNGALLGEAIVINNPMLITHFRYAIKQKGALLAKGRLLGIQFSTLFTDDLFFKIGAYANEQASKLAQAFLENGYSFLTEPASNQIFPILENSLISRLKEDYDFHIWQKLGEHTAAIRLVTSWATSEEEVQKLINLIAKHPYNQQ